MCVILGQIVRHARQARVHVAAAQILGCDDLARGGLDQRRTGQKDGALIAHDDRHVGHGRHVSPACRT